MKTFSKIISVVCISLILSLLQGCGSQQETPDKPLETLPINEVSLEDLSAFQPVGANWSIEGGVQSDRKKEHDLHGLEGKGILVNRPTEENQDHLLTKWEHGDLELELDFLMPKNSNSGVYFMGRYEAQLFDSWGVEDPQFSDVGGIYQRWDESRPEGQKGFEGKAPRMNAARAPGLWQHYRILFKAPQFNDEGEKISNAEFEEVWLNGVLVQKDIEVTGPTRAAPFEDEKSAGPLMIQGDHGPVAIRNITYKRYDKKQIALDNLSYEYYPEAFDQWPDFSSLETGETGTVDSLDGNVVNRDDRYAVRYTGSLQAPNSGTYLFKLLNAGRVRMLIDDKPIFDQNRIYRMHELVSETVELESGRHSFTLEYIDHPNNWYTGLSLFAEGPKLRLQKLHASSSVPGGDRELPDLIVDAEDHIRVIRSFGMHKGRKRTQVVNVGAPDGVNFNYDLGQAALLHTWNGPFINTNQMWINRGEPQIATPAGPAVTLEGEPSLALLEGPDSSWPDSVSGDMLHLQGYRISNEGWPVFQYSIGDAAIKDQLMESSDHHHISRTISAEAPEASEELWFHLASGKTISQKQDGEYVIDDRRYYLNVEESGGSKPVLRKTEMGQELLVPMLRNRSNTIVKYSIIW